MPFATGTARTPSELLNAINTHLTANGWTRLRGETDMACASPKAARYWRMIVWETQTTNIDFRGLQLFNLRTTAGGANQSTVGANFSSSSVGTGTASLMVAGGILRSADIDDQAWTLTYDFGSPVTVREFYLRGDSVVGNCPRDFAFQWSNDGVVWTTMREYNDISWTANEFKTFTIDDGYLYPNHVADDAPRRSGNLEDFQQNIAWTTSARRDFSEDVWSWQGPGYDAARRVYIHARSNCFPSGSTHTIMWDFSTENNALTPQWNENVGSNVMTQSHLMNSDTVTYWIYSNSKRLVLVTRSGAQDYTSSYVGFMSAFATPDDYPFPLIISTTMSNYSEFTSGQANAKLSSCADPGSFCASARLWDGNIIIIGNRQNSNTSNLYLPTPGTSWIWPYHFGSTFRPSWPEGMGSDHVDYVAAHAFDYVRATEQDELPLVPCIVQNDPYGNIGALDGVFAIPSGSLLTPTQVIVVGGQNYRVFPNRTRREPVAWFCIRED